MENILSFKTDHWNSHTALDHVKESTTPNAKMFFLFINKEEELCWSTNGFHERDLLGALEQAKFAVLAGEL